MDYIATPGAPKPAGHYSQGVRHAGLVHVAGQLPLDPATGELVGAGDIVAQTERTLRNVEAILQAAGSALERTLSVTVYVTDRALWPKVNETYARIFGAHKPARAVIPVKELKPGCLIEIQAVGATEP
ncbi:MAG: Rid family detoxifying hydrolase [Planctomycetota bacterium]|nr:Rid family detoxifying hydrolase [Planctomycetota bacterium]